MSVEIIAAIIAGLLSVSAVIYSQQKNKEREIAAAQRPQKINMYQDFMNELILKTLKPNKGNKSNLSEKKLEEFFYKFTSEIIIWGSPGVISAYENFRQFSDPKNPNILFLVDKILREIRVDLGSNNKGIKNGDLISLFLNDPDTLKEMIK